MTFPDMVRQNMGANPLATRARKAFHRHMGVGICLGALLRTGDTQLLMCKRAKLLDGQLFPIRPPVSFQEMPCHMQPILQYSQNPQCELNILSIHT